MSATPDALGFYWWLIAQAESNELEGQTETAEGLRELAELVREKPGAFEAWSRVREQAAQTSDGEAA